MTEETTIPTATIPADGVILDKDQVIEAVEKTIKQSSLWSDYDSRHVYKANVEYVLNSGDNERLTIYCYTTGFEMARAIINRTQYMTSKHGRIISLAETAGIFTE